MKSDLEKMLSIAIECQESDLSTEEVCRKHGVKVHTYYRWRKKLVRAGLEALKSQFRQQDDRAELIQKNKELNNKVKRLEQNKAMWELRYKWLCWHLENHHQPEIRKMIHSLKAQSSFGPHEETGTKLKKADRI